jgi:hypothetical protein
MSDIDFSRLQPLRVATGTHRAGSGYGCAMNVVSYITGDVAITDYPACASADLARMVQLVNDHLGIKRGSKTGLPFSQVVLTPEDALTAIRLGCMTIGTAGVDFYVVYAIGNEVAAEFGFTVHKSAPQHHIQRLRKAGYPPETIVRYAERVLTKVREAAGLDAAEEVTNLPEGVLL